MNITDAIGANKMDLKLTDVGAERALLAALIQYGVDAYVTVSDFITVNSFGHANNQIIYRCIE